MPSLPKLSGINKPFGFDEELRKCLAETISASAKSRAAIAEELEQQTGLHISLSMLNDFTAMSHGGARFPAAWVPAFCEITGDDRLLRMLLSEEVRARLEVVDHELSARRHEMNAQREQRAKEDIVNRLLGDGKPNSKDNSRA